MIVVGLVVDTPSLTVSRRGRAVLSFNLQAEPDGRVLRIVVRGEKARRWSEVIQTGLEVRLNGEVRTVVFMRAKGLQSATERWRVRRAS